MYYNPNQSFMGGWPGFGGAPMGGYGGVASPMMMQMGNAMNWGGFQPQMQNMMHMIGQGQGDVYYPPQGNMMRPGMEPQYIGRAQHRPMPEGGGQYQNMMAPARASRPGMQYRADRRQAKRQGTYDPNAAPAGPAQQTMAPGNPSAGWANDPNGQPGSEAMAGFFNSPFGQLTTASGGNGNMFKRQGASEQDGMFFYDPNAGGWNQTSLNDYRAGAGANAVDPNQAQYRDQAGIQRQQFQRTNVPPHLRGF